MNNRTIQLRRLLVLAIGLVLFLQAQSYVTQTVITTFRPQLDIFNVASPSYTLSEVPAPQGQVMVFVDGLLMQRGIDYDLSGSTLTFTGTPTSDINQPSVQIMYWVVE
jgi:hypothetical protein